MSNSVDTRVVEMRFDNQDFEKNVSISLETIEKLKNALHFDKTATELSRLRTNLAQKIDVTPFTGALDVVQERFSTLGIVGATIITNLTNTFVDKAKSILTAIPKQISQGGLARAMNIEQAKFQLKGLGIAWKDIEEDISYGVKDTAYGLDAAAKAAAQLVTSDVALGKEMKTSLRAISGVASMTGRSYEDISYIFTTVAGLGRLQQMQLRQLAISGLKASKSVVDFINGVNDGSIKASEQAKKEIKEFTGGLQVTQQDMDTFTRKGVISYRVFAEAMDHAFGEHAKKSNETYSGSLANVKAALSRIGAEVKASRLENLKNIFNALRPLIDKIHSGLMSTLNFINKLSTAISNKLIKVIERVNLDSFFMAIDTALKDISVNKIVRSVGQAFSNLGTIIKSIAITIKNNIEWALNTSILLSFIKIGKTLLGFLSKAHSSLNSYISSSDFIDLLYSIGKVVQGITLVFYDFYNVIRNVFKLIAPELSKTIEKITGGAPVLTAISRLLTSVFNKIGDILIGISGWSDGINKLTNYLFPLCRAFDEVVLAGFKPFIDWFNSFSKSIKSIEAPLDSLKNILLTIEPIFAAIIDAGARALGRFTAAVKDLGVFEDLPVKIFSGFIALMSALWTGRLLEGLFDFKKDLQKFKKQFLDIFGSMLTPIKDLLQPGIDAFNKFLESINKSLEALQRNLNAKTLVAIATAIAILAGSMFVLSRIDPKKIDGAITSLTGLITTLSATMWAFSKMQTSFSMVTMYPMVISIALAVILLASAMEKLSQIDGDKLTTGLKGVTALLGELSLFLSFTNFQKMGKRTASTLIGLSVAMYVMAAAIEKLGGLELEVLAKGIGAISGVLLSFGIFSKLIDSKGLLGVSVSLIAVAFAMNQMSDVIIKLGNVDIATLATGVITLAASLTSIALAMRLMPDKGAVGKAVSIIIIAESLKLASDALQKVGSMEWDNIMRGLTGLLVSLGAMVIASKVAKHDLAGAAGIATVAGVLIMVAEALKQFAVLGWEQLAIGLLGLSGSLLALGVAARFMDGSLKGAFALAVLSSTLLVLAGAVKIFSTMSLGEVAIGIIGLAGALMAIVGVAYVAGLVVPGLLALSAALFSIGTSMVEIGAAAFLFASAIAMIAGMGVTLEKVMDGIPNFMEFLKKSINSFLDMIVDVIPKFIDTIFVIIDSFVTSLNKRIPTLVDQLLEMLLVLINSLSEGVEKYGEKIVYAALNLAYRIIEAVVKAIINMFPEIKEVGSQLVNKLAEGVEKLKNLVKEKFVEMMTRAKEAVEEKKTAFIEAMHNIVTSIGQWFSNQWETFKSWGSNIVQGLKEGLENTPIIGSIISFAKNIKKTFTGEMEMHSPSKVFFRYGVYLVDGLIDGLAYRHKDLDKAMKKIISASMVHGVILEFNKATRKETKKETAKLIDSMVKDVTWGKKAIKEYARDYGNITSKMMTFNEKYYEQLRKTRGETEALAYKNESYTRSLAIVAGVTENAKRAIGNLSKHLYLNSDAYKDAIDNVTAYNKAIKEQQDKRKENLKKIDKLEEKLKKTKNKKKRKEIKNEIKQLKKDNKEIYDTVKSLNKGLEKELKGIAEGPSKAFKEFRKSLKDNIASSLDILGASVNDYVNLFEKMEEVEEVSVDQLLYNMYSQIKGVSEWREDLDKLADKGIAEGLLQKLRDMGPEGAKYVKAFLKMTKDELKKANTLFKAEGELAAQSLLDDMKGRFAAVDNWSKNIDKLAEKGIHSGLLEQLITAGPENADYVQALANMTETQLAEVNSLFTKTSKLSSKAADNVLAALGLSLKKTDEGDLAKDTGETIGKALSKALSYAFEEPISEEDVAQIEENTKSVGYAIGSGISVGIESSKQDVKDASKLVGTSAVNEFKTYFSTSNGSTIAVQITNGLVSGLDSGQEDVADAARNLAIAAYGAMKEELGIHSPSKRMEEIGKYSDMGLARGLLKYTSFVTSSANALGDETYNSLKNTMSVLCDSVMDEIGQPVIRPTLDLTDINNKAGRVNDLFASGKIVASDDPNNRLQNGGTIQFVQNNYSPKALSRIDIYRQTRNQISAFKNNPNIAYRGAR